MNTGQCKRAIRFPKIGTNALDGIFHNLIHGMGDCFGESWQESGLNLWGKWFVEQASRYSRERMVFDRQIGANQGIQFPIAKAHIQIEAADLMRNRAVALFDAGAKCANETSMAKYIASEAAWEAAEAAMTTFGGYGVACEYDIERKWKESRLFRTAPLSNNLILAQIAQHALDMPRSY